MIDPSGLPSEAGGGAAWGLSSQQHENAKWPRMFLPRCRTSRHKRDAKGIPYPGPCCADPGNLGHDLDMLRPALGLTLLHFKQGPQLSALPAFIA